MSLGSRSGQEVESLLLGWALQTSPASLAFLSPSGNDHLVMLTVGGDLYTLGSGEQGQLGRVPELFANRGGRQGLGRWLFVFNLFLSVLGLNCCMGFSLVVASRGYSLVVVLNFSLQWLLLLRSTESRAHRLQ